MASTGSSEVSLNTSSDVHLLWEANEKIARILIPAMIFIGVLMIAGFVGNSLVCYVFIRHMKISVSTFLLLVLAFLDIMNCSLAMPFEITDMRFFHMFSSDTACKIFRLLVAFPNINSMFILLLITIDRYKKVCQPMKQQMKFREAKWSVALVTAFSLLMSFPALYIYGLRTVPVGTDGLSGRDCSSRDEMEYSLVPLIYQAFGSAVMFVIFLTLCYLYVCIWREIRRHKQFTRNNTQLALRVSVRENQSNSDSSQSKDRGSRIKFARGQRVTVIAFVVTLFFMISNLPVAVIMVVRPLQTGSACKSNSGCLVIYNILIRSFFISSVVNPIIYGFMSKRFRAKCRKFIRLD